MKKMLLLGGSYAEIPLIKAAKKAGYYIITTGNQTDGLGHSYGDEYINCDFSDRNAICELARRLDVDAICSGCNDFAYLSAAYACERLGLPGHDAFETARKIHHKDQYRKLAQQLGIAAPRAYQCRNEEEMQEAAKHINFPVIVKPVDLTGGKGMKRCDEEEQLKDAFYSAMQVTREDHIVLEEFVVGTNHGFSAYIQDQRVSFWFVDNEQYYHNPYLVSGASAPGDVPDDAIGQLCRDCEKIAQKLQLKDGILHIQFILDKNFVPVIIEICRRSPGDLYVHLVELARGIDYAEYIVAGETGTKMPPPVSHKTKGCYIRHCIMADAEGILEDVCIAKELEPYILEKMLWYHKGEHITDMYKYKAGILFLYFEKETEYRYYLEKLTQLVTIKVRQESRLK